MTRWSDNTIAPEHTITPEEIKSLVRPTHVHRRAYADPDVYELEQRLIFGRLWLYVAHESQLKAAGDFVRTRLGPFEVLITRHTDGKIYALQNRCPHRGARICMVDHGNSKILSCPYHAWAFRPDGSLASVPHLKSYPKDFKLDDPQNHMQRIGHVNSYRGFVFATLNDSPPPLTEALRPMTDAIDNLIDRAPDGEIEISEASFSIEYRGNWKLHLENAVDVFHPSFVHGSSVGPARRAPANASILDQDQTREMLLANGFGYEEWENFQLHGHSSGHVYMSNIYKKGVLTSQVTDPVAVQYKAALVEKRGLQRAEEILGVNRFNNIIYPNLIINAQYQQMRVTIPIAVDRTLIRIYCFRLKGAPEGMFHRAVRFQTTLGSPASMIFSDDVEMLERCQQGLARDVGPWIDFSRGLENDRRSEDGQLASAASEMPMRVQFETWLNYLTAETA